MQYFKTGEKLFKTLVPMELDDCDLPYIADFLRLLREAEKKVLLLMAGPRGPRGGCKGAGHKRKNTFFGTFFSNLSIFQNFNGH